MKESEVTRQINADHEKFVNSIYSGKIKPPEDIIETFKHGITAMPSFAHKIMGLKIKTICSKEFYELTVSDLNDIIKVVFNISPERLYPFAEFEEMVDRLIYLDKFVLCFNTTIETFSKELNEKKERLRTLSDGILQPGLRAIPSY